MGDVLPTRPPGWGEPMRQVRDAPAVWVPPRWLQALYPDTTAVEFVRSPHLVSIEWADHKQALRVANRLACLTGLTMQVRKRDGGWRVREFDVTPW